MQANVSIFTRLHFLVITAELFFKLDMGKSQKVLLVGDEIQARHRKTPWSVDGAICYGSGMALVRLTVDGKKDEPMSYPI